MSNTGSNRLVNASTDGNGDSHVCEKITRERYISSEKRQYINDMILIS